MSARAPSPYQLQQAFAVLMAARERLLAEDPDMAETDQKLFVDMLDGESGDAMEMLDRVITAAIEADDLAAAAVKRAQETRERAARFKHRHEQLRGVAFALLDALEIRKLERPAYTASIRPGQQTVQIIDMDALPAAMVRIERKPDKALIGAALKAGNDVPGAELSNSIPSLAIRTK